jgi:hypothetical protein
MIDEKTLADPTSCPSCRAPLAGASMASRAAACPSCGVALAGPLAARLWELSTTVVRLLAERREVLAAMRRAAQSGEATAAESGAARAAPGAGPAGPATPGPATSPARSSEPVAGRTSRGASRYSVQDILLGLGALLLAVAAVIFLVVSWGSLGVGGRSLVMAGATALTVAGAALAHRRSLGSSAEALAALAVGLALLDAFGVRRTGLGGIDAAAGTFYWAGATGVVAAVCAAGAVLLPLRSLRLSATILGQVPAWLVGVELASRADRDEHALLLLAAVLTAQAAALLGAGHALRRIREARDARLVVLAALPVTGSVAVWIAAVGTYDDPAPVGAGALVLLGGAMVAALTASAHHHRAAVRHIGAGIAWFAAFAAASRPLQDLATSTWRPADVTLLAVAGLVALVAVPRSARAGPVAVAGAVLLGSLGVVSDRLLLLVVGPLSWLGDPWSVPSAATLTAREALVTATGSRGFGAQWSGGPEIAAVALLAALGVLAAGLLLARRREASWMAAPVALLGLLAVPLALDTSYVLALFLQVALAVGLVAAGEALPPRRTLLTGGGVVALTLAVCWSTAVAAATVVLLAVGIIVLGVLAGRTTRPARARATRPVEAPAWAAAATLLAGLEVLACVRWLGGSWATAGVLLTLTAASGLVVAALLAPPPAPTRHAPGKVDAVRTALSRPGPWPSRSGRPRAAAVAVAAAVAAPGSLGLALAAPDPLALVVALGAALVAVVVTAVAAHAPGRPGAPAVAAALGCAEILAAARWGELPPATSGLILVCVLGSCAVAGSVAAASASSTRWSGAVRSPAARAAARTFADSSVRVVGGAAAAIGVALSALDLDRLWVALLVAGVAAAAAAAGAAVVATATAAAARPLGWLSGGLILASSWVRLALSDVDAPEAYTAPAGMALLALGALRRRADPATESTTGPATESATGRKAGRGSGRGPGSWSAYGGGLVLVLVPSLFRALTDPGLVRPLLLGAVALAVLLIGVRHRLAAPLALGGGVLAADALVQLSPYLAAAYAAVPRWVAIGAAGLALLALGVTYERRLRELRGLGEHLTRLQ